MLRCVVFFFLRITQLWVGLVAARSCRRLPQRYQLRKKTKASGEKKYWSYDKCGESGVKILLKQKSEWATNEKKKFEMKTENGMFYNMLNNGVKAGMQSRDTRLKTTSSGCWVVWNLYAYNTVFAVTKKTPSTYFTEK